MQVCIWFSSKWIATSSATSAKNWELNSFWTIVTDNGTCFTSADFETFLQSYGVLHLHHYHAASNGLAECAVQIVKKELKKSTSGTVQERFIWHIVSPHIRPLVFHPRSSYLEGDLVLVWTYSNRIRPTVWRSSKRSRKSITMPKLEVGNSMLGRELHFKLNFSVTRLITTLRSVIPLAG